MSERRHDDHLSKPFNMLVLQEMLARWLAPTESKQTEAAELAAQATAKAAEVLDRQMLDQLSKVVTNGKPELLSRVIKLYLVESPKLIQQLQQAGMEDNAPQIASCAHALKSCSANVGATLLSRYCTDIEASARRGDTDDARKILAKVEAEHACVQSALTTQVELDRLAR